LDRFGFELETEIRRIGGRSAAAHVRTADNDEATSVLQCETALLATVRQYEKTLGLQMPAHARAMVQRQLQTLRRFMTESE